MIKICDFSYKSRFTETMMKEFVIIAIYLLIHINKEPLFFIYRSVDLLKKTISIKIQFLNCNIDIKRLEEFYLN